jgi:(R,R)-butanediol dehydrogenase/meso-butanediol dehydrogenase/diacetyl reductase
VRVVEVGVDRALTEVSVAEPEPGAGQVLIEVACCGICGSDVHFRPIPDLFPDGTIPGHELSGRIAALGPGGSHAGWSLGDRVAVLPFGQCGECDLCRSGNEQACRSAVPNGIGLGTGRAGGFGEHVVADLRMLFRLPDCVSDRDAALTEPVAVAIRAVNAAQMPLDAPIVVLGTGTIGVLVGLVLRARGYSRFVLVSRNPARGARASSLGLPVVSLEEFSGGSAPGGGHPGEAAPAAPVCVLECAGTPSAAALAVDVLAPLGRLILVGMSLEPLELAAPAILIKELSIRGVIAYRRDEFQAAIDLLAGGAIPVDELVTATVGLDQVGAAFAALSAPGNEHLKVLISPGSDLSL